MSLERCWQPLPSVQEYVTRFAILRSRKIYDVGGRKGKSLCDAESIGWEGDLKRDLEEPLEFPAERPFVYCRHTLEDLANPKNFLASIRDAAGYIETPSPLAELTRGVDGSDYGHRGYLHHRWIVGYINDVLTFIPKYPVLEWMDLPLIGRLREKLEAGPLHWNTYCVFGEGELKYKILRHEEDFRVNDFRQYTALVQDMAEETFKHNWGVWDDIVTEKFTIQIPPTLRENLESEPPKTKPSKTSQLPEIETAEPQETLQVKLMFARFPGGGVDRSTVTNWLVAAAVAAKADPRIDSDIINWDITDTPITMGRNRCIEVARSLNVDFLVMVDNDMAPDRYLPSNHKGEFKDYSSKPFFQSSLDFLYDRRIKEQSPAIIGAPYCGPPPMENVYVFHWDNNETNGPEDNGDISLQQFTRQHASSMRGITEVAALPTGLIMIDMKAIEHTSPPYFYYEWKDETQSDKASTEDVTFTRDLSLNGVPQFCNWDAWCGHWKDKCVGRPRLLSPASVSAKLRRPLLAKYNIMDGEELVMIKGDGNGRAAGPENVPQESSEDTETQEAESRQAESQAVNRLCSFTPGRKDK